MQHFPNIFSMYNTLKIGAMEWIQAKYVCIHVVTLYIIFVATKPLYDRFSCLKNVRRNNLLPCLH